MRRGPGDEAADLQQALADASADRRTNRCVFQIQLGAAENGAVRFDRRFARDHRRFAGLTSREGVVEVLPRRRLFLDQRFQALDILPSLQQCRLGLGDVRRRLRERAARALDLRLVRPQVEDVQHLSGAHIRSDVERSSVDVAVDAPTHFHEVTGVRAGGIFAIGRDVFARDVKDADFWRRRWNRLGGRLPSGGREQSDRYCDEQDPRRRPVGAPPRRRRHKRLLPAVSYMMTVMYCYL